MRADVDELRMWPVSSSAWTEAKFIQKEWMAGVMRPGMLIARVHRRWCCIYRQRSPSENNGSCLEVRDIHLGLWWHNTLGTQCLPTQVHSQLQVILPNQIVSAHQILFLNITWHQTEAHSGTRSFHHQFHLSYQLTSQVTILQFKTSPTSTDSFYYSSEDSKAYQLWSPQHHCFTFGNFHMLLWFFITWSLTHQTQDLYSKSSLTAICVYHMITIFINQHLYQTQFKSFVSFNFISFLGKHLHLWLHLFLSINKMATNPTPIHTKADLLLPNSKKAPTIFSGH